MTSNDKTKTESNVFELDPLWDTEVTGEQVRSDVLEFIKITVDRYLFIQEFDDVMITSWFLQQRGGRT